MQGGRAEGRGVWRLFGVGLSLSGLSCVGWQLGYWICEVREVAGMDSQLDVELCAICF